MDLTPEIPFSNNHTDLLYKTIFLFSLDGLMFSCVSFGDGNVAWAVDILGRIFFMTNVTMETPLGDNCWWQVIHKLVFVHLYSNN